VNGQPIGDEPQRLNGGDIIDLAGTQMQFLQG
jgi:pSer/pThr/pTyr-binding forkhead associated (FHA) protein